MIKKIQFNQYRKLKNVDLEFTPDLNVISGTNGTCKTSILHLISNSFQAVTSKCEWVNDKKSLQLIKIVNSVTNPKIESLTRGDQQYNDPAYGVSGNLYNVKYFGYSPLAFRRHNSKTANRYALKPVYKKNSGEKLPFMPVVYLGLSRLVPYGEYQNDTAVSKVKQSLPDEFKKAVAENYAHFTNYVINNTSLQQMGDIKTRAEFSSDQVGIDSNTISAGEDNLYIILAALESLKSYYASIESRNSVESVLLIDEFDATLHPYFQIALLELFKKYAEEAKIQIIFTSHSLSAIDYLIKMKANVIYLVNNITDVILMEEPTIQKINAHLNTLTVDDIYSDKCIPVFTEDAEARFLLQRLISFYEKNKIEFRGIARFFNIPEINIGSEILTSLFHDEKLIKSQVGAICVLDGDKTTKLNDCIITLPGKNGGQSSSKLSPENLMFAYAQKLFDDDDSFWKDRQIIDKGYTKTYYVQNIQRPLADFKAKIDVGETTEKPREFNKKLFNKYALFFDYLFKHWMNNPLNQNEVETFYKNLKIMFKKVAYIRGINPEEWK